MRQIHILHDRVIRIIRQDTRSTLILSNRTSSTIPQVSGLTRTATKYGFIIRYPKGKEGSTGYMYEPWHVRYIGVDLATKVTQSGLSLEEYFGITSQYQD